MTAWEKRCRPHRQPDSHKGTYGTVFSVCGQDGMAGAAILSARAAYRCGAGLVALSVPRCIYPAIAAAVPEAVCTVDTPPAASPFFEKATALLIGCGLGQGDRVREALAIAAGETTRPVVIDADGLNALAAAPAERGTAPWILTPHPAEAGRLLGISAAAIQQDRDGAACQIARRYHAVAVLKGHQTVVADESGVLYRNKTGNPGMATAGSGDVLAGMIAGLLAQGVDPVSAAIGGVILHGKAGDVAAERVSQQALIASDIIEALCEILNS